MTTQQLTKLYTIEIEVFGTQSRAHVNATWTLDPIFHDSLNHLSHKLPHTKIVKQGGCDSGKPLKSGSRRIRWRLTRFLSKCSSPGTRSQTPPLRRTRHFRAPRVQRPSVPTHLQNLDRDRKALLQTFKARGRAKKANMPQMQELFAEHVAKQNALTAECGEKRNCSGKRSAKSWGSAADCTRPRDRKTFKTATRLRQNQNLCSLLRVLGAILAILR
jgi:hypothetical protein